MFFAGQATLDKLKKFRDKHPGADLFKNRELYYYLHQYETNGGIIDRADTPDLYALKSLSENDGTRVDVKASYLH